MIPAAVDRQLDELDGDAGRGAYVGRQSREPCRCADCIARDPSRAVPTETRRVPPARRPICPGCGAARGLAGRRLCWKCAPKGSTP